MHIYFNNLPFFVPQKNLSSLGNLDLFNNPCSTDEDEFRKKVFEMLPSLKYLDSADVNNEEVDDSDIENDLDNNGVGGGEDDEDDDDDDDLDDEELDEEDDEEEENQGPTGGKAGATEEVCNNEMLSLY